MDFQKQVLIFLGRCGFDRGRAFEDEQEVRDYFTRRHHREMGWRDEDIPSDEVLKLAADYVIIRRLHFAYVERLRKLAMSARDLRYDTRDARDIIGREDWRDCRPLCDSRGLLTGEIVNSSHDGWASVDGLAAILIEDLTDEQIAANGGEQAVYQAERVDLHLHKLGDSR